MERSEVVDHVVLMPMQIKMQREGGKLIAVMPGWLLPTNLIVEGSDTDDALDKLRQRMRQYWGVEPSSDNVNGIAPEGA